MLDENDDSDKGSNTIHSNKEGVMFYRQTGPVPLQKRFPQLLTEMLDLIKLHSFAAHVRRRSWYFKHVWGTLRRHTTACAEKCGWFDQDFKAKNLQSFKTSP